VRAIPSADGRLVTIELEVAITEIESPVAKEDTEHGEVHRPVTQTHRLATTVSLEPGSPVLFTQAGLRRPGEAGAQELVLLLTVTEVRRR
jgi:hypothetical protein